MYGEAVVRTEKARNNSNMISQGTHLEAARWPLGGGKKMLGHSHVPSLSKYNTLHTLPLELGLLQSFHAP